MSKKVKTKEVRELKTYEVIEAFSADLFGHQFSCKVGDVIELTDDELGYLRNKVK